jgi:hypothetical protein
MDAAFQPDFDLTPVMRVHEMQNPLPQEEKLWAASSAQAWAGFQLARLCFNWYPIQAGPQCEIRQECSGKVLSCSNSLIPLKRTAPVIILFPRCLGR